MRHSCASRVVVLLLLLLTVSVTPLRAADELPSWLQQAQNAVSLVVSKADTVPELADDILIVRNTLRATEAEYQKSLGWTGKLDPKAEPAVRHLAEMARLQASVILARAAQRDHEKALKQFEQQSGAVRSKIKVFDDLLAQVRNLRKQTAEQSGQIDGLKAQVASLTAELAAKGSAISSSDQKTSDLLKALDEQKKATAASQHQVMTLTRDLEGLKKETTGLKSAEQRLADDNRRAAFELGLYRLGGSVKTGEEVQSVTFARARLLKASGKSTTLTVEGTEAVAGVVALLKTYPEYRLKLRVHGFGQPVRSEDAAATDQMARFLREALLSKGGFEPSVVEALGVGAAEPLYPKKNVEGNRRIEIIFVKK